MSTIGRMLGGRLMPCCRMFGALLKKNLILRKRHYIITAIEAIIPLLLVLPILWMNPDMSQYSSSRSFSHNEGPKTFESKSIRSEFNQLYLGSDPKVLYYPNDTKTLQLLSDVFDDLRAIEGPAVDKVKFIGFKTEEKMKDFITASLLNDEYDSRIMFGFVLKELNANNLDYKILKEGSMSYDTSGDGLYTRSSSMRYAYGTETTLRTFLIFQHLIDERYRKSTSSLKDESFDVLIQSFPAPPEDNFQVSGIVVFVSLMISLSLTFFIASLIGRLIQEKSSRMKEMLKLTGMTSWMHWASWFLNGFIFLFVVFILMIGILSINVPGYLSVFSKANKFFVIMFMMFYAVSTVLLCFTISILFPRAVFGCLIGILIWIATTVVPVVVFSPLLRLGYTMSPMGKLCSCIIPNFALFWFLSITLSLDYMGMGLGVDTLNEEVEHISYSYVLLVMFLSWFLYGVLIWYLEAVWPFQSGVPRPFYFPCTKSYWCGMKAESEVKVTDSTDAASEYFEMNTIDQSAGINIKKLSKIYHSMKEKKVAVDNLSLKLYKGEITAVLGHNGAGKTTTISVISGMITPSSGTVLVNGYDVRQDISKARRSMGFCPQESIFFNELSVREHLDLIATLKGGRRGDLNSDIANVSKAVELHDKLDSLASTLSGGMKRKLSLAMAMIGNSQVLLLDEPTSGLDPEARRKIWDMLLSLRLEKTILLTTHYMEEADALGDKIAIMTHGKVFCCGSAMFLKNAFDAGYHLRMIKAEECDVDNVTNRIKEFLPVKIERDFGQELSYKIETSDPSQFPAVFDLLEREKKEIGIENFGLSVTNMEDVFLSVGNMVESEKMQAGDSVQRQTSLTSTKEAVTSKFYQNITGIRLIPLQIWALILKRFHFNRRQISSLIIQVILPFLLFYGAYSICEDLGTNKQFQKEREFKLSIYGDTQVVHNLTGTAGETYADLVRQQSSTAKHSSNVSDALLNIGYADPYKYKTKHIVAAYREKKSNENKFVAMFNPTAKYSIGIAVNLLHNVILKLQGSDAKIQSSINFYDSAFKYHQSGLPLVVFSYMTPIGFAFLTTFCIIFIVTERTSKSKHLQLMTSLNRFTYWLGNLIYDFFCCFIASLPIIIIMACDTRGFNRNSDSMGGAMIALMLYLIAGVMFSYVMSFIFNRPAVGFTVVSIALVLVAMVMMTMNVIFGQFDSDVNYAPTKALGKAEWVFRFFPTFPFVKIISYIKAQTSIRSQCDGYQEMCDSLDTNTSNFYRQCCEDFQEYNPFGHGSKLRDEYHMLLASSVIYAILLFLIEWPLVNRYIFYLYDKIRLRAYFQTQVRSKSSLDDDISQNNLVIENLISEHQDLNLGDYALVVHNLTKQFPKVLAVNKLSFGVPKDQCFGLLGVNGAGKTTSFSMLTGDIRITEGNAYIQGINLKSQRSRFQQQIGYCPQFDAHLELLTGEELLHLFARLRGIPPKDTKKAVSALVQMVDLQDHAANRCGNYSGGNKRKLSIAISMIGLPRLLFLDEPTAGIDPFARRQIWNLIASIKSSGIAVVLTSHSMEECEALCDCLSIMVNGQIQCIGSITYLKNKFGQGFTIEAKQKISPQQDNAQKLSTIKSKISEHIPSALCKEEHQGVLMYHVTDVNESWSKMFRTMEKLKNEDLLENYNISATSLEQVFLSFARLRDA